MDSRFSGAVRSALRTADELSGGGRGGWEDEEEEEGSAGGLGLLSTAAELFFLVEDEDVALLSVRDPGSLLFSVEVVVGKDFFFVFSETETDDLVLEGGELDEELALPPTGDSTSFMGKMFFHRKQYLNRTFYLLRHAKNKRKGPLQD